MSGCLSHVAPLTVVLEMEELNHGLSGCIQ